MTLDSQMTTGALLRERFSSHMRRIKGFWSLYKGSRIGMLGVFFVLVFIVLAAAAPWLAPYDPRALVGTSFLPPTGEHLLGTDQVGRDIFSELIWGTRISLLVGLLASAVAVAIGTVIGLLSGYYRGPPDSILMRITDLFITLPNLPFMLILAALIGRSVWNIIFVIAITGWTGTAKMVRSQTLSIKERPYVEAARSVGARDSHIVIRHILPNVFPLVFANAIVGIVDAILAESGLSFLGLGDPTKPSWGLILRHANEAGALATGRWWFIIPPGICLMLLAIGFAFSSYSLDQILNPRLRRRRW
ncbi:MAG: ABC transporter permease [Candidatus Bathyarchaeota archaeon]|nr:ABC transporter permease [Candidatus Bathyarchaeota archaeon]